MNSEKLLDAIGLVGDDLIEEAREPRKDQYAGMLRIAIAACLILIAGIIGFPLINTPTSASPDQGYIGDPASDPGDASASINETGFFITAQALDTLPDTYLLYNDWYSTPYRLVKMKTLNLLLGDEMPDEFYFLVPEELLVDFTRYDALILEFLDQISCENAILYNCSSDSAEALDCYLFGYWNYFRCAGVKAFSGNFFDESLWLSNEVWLAETEYARQQLDEGKNPKNLQRGWSLQQVEQSTKENYAYHAAKLKTHAAVTTENAMAIRNYIAPFENGIFVPEFAEYPSLFLYRRYIDGIATNETVLFQSGEGTHSGVPFNEEDLTGLPDLPAAMSSVKAAFDRGEIKPPHIQDLSQHELRTYGIRCWYFKAEDGSVYGAIQVSFTYGRKSETTGFYSDFRYDDLYYIVDPGSNSFTEITRDALLELQGTSDFLYTGSYDSNGKVPPMCFA